MSGCDCSRCQTEGCVANTYCPCCLKAERDVLRAQIERVRELCEQIVVTADPSARNKYGARHGHWVAQTILRALEEGDVDE